MEALTALISILRPRAASTKVITGSGRWGTVYSGIEATGFGLVLEGECYLSVDGPPVRVQEGDFVLMPPKGQLSMFSDPGAEQVPSVPQGPGEPARDRHYGNPDAQPDFRLLGGYFWLEPANAPLVSMLLPSLLHVRNATLTSKRVLTTIGLLADEATSDRAGRDLVLGRLVEVILVEALRLASEDAGIKPLPGLLEGLADPHLAAALRSIHTDVARQWTVVELARTAGLSRSAFFDRFTRKIGVPPKEYLLRWRMALAKDMLRGSDVPLERVASSLGYQSASAFGAAFTREVGQPPSRYARGLPG